MLMKRMLMAAASGDGQFMERKHLHEFDSICLHGIFRPMTALIIELMPPMHIDAGMNNSNSIIIVIVIV